MKKEMPVTEYFPVTVGDKKIVLKYEFSAENEQKFVSFADYFRLQVVNDIPAEVKAAHPDAITFRELQKTLKATPEDVYKALEKLPGICEGWREVKEGKLLVHSSMGKHYIQFSPTRVKRGLDTLKPDWLSDHLSRQAFKAADTQLGAVMSDIEKRIDAALDELSYKREGAVRKLLVEAFQKGREAAQQAAR